MPDAERLHALNDAPPGNGKYVLYWMQQSQRAAHNPALEYAVRKANELDQPCLVAFGLMADYPEAQASHYRFMLQGLAEVTDALADRGIKLVARRGEPHKVAAQLAGDASLVVCDVGYLRHQRRWRRELAGEVSVRTVAIEGDVVVPVRTASDKPETAARTLRPKIQRKTDEFLGALSATRPRKQSLPLRVTGDIDLRRTERVLKALAPPDDVDRDERFRGGTSEARRRLTAFIRGRLSGYADARNDPADPSVSALSPYLHFGQISPVEVARKIRRAKAGSPDDKQAYLEELIVRRELAVNFVFYTDDYDRYSCLPRWARDTLDAHAHDERPHRYTRDELERARTHDPYWNAAMCEAKKTGYMHNYMRMYWGKKILEWTDTPEKAYATALYLNNRYFLDGRDPSSYANVGWLFGLHDRGWGERSVFGKVRYMNAAGLRRKFDIDGYVERVASL